IFPLLAILRPAVALSLTAPEKHSGPHQLRGDHCYVCVSPGGPEGRRTDKVLSFSSTAHPCAFILPHSHSLPFPSLSPSPSPPPSSFLSPRFPLLPLPLPLLFIS